MWGFRVLGFRVQGCRASGFSGFRVLGFWDFRVQGYSCVVLGFRVVGFWGSGFRVGVGSLGGLGPGFGLSCVFCLWGWGVLRGWEGGFGVGTGPPSSGVRFGSDP